MFRRKLRPVHLVYVDDSSDNADYCVMGAAIISEADFGIMEGWLKWSVDQLVPPEARETLEFHASVMFNRKPPFQDISRETALHLMERCAEIVGTEENRMVYGAVDLRKLRRSPYTTARPQDVAFRVCMEGLQKYFCDHCASAPGQNAAKPEIGLMICDDTSNANLKKDFQQSYRAFRGRIDPGATERRKLSDWLHDDMYFGDSSHSVGLQVADVCSYLVLRHLQGQADTEHLYKVIEPHLFFGKLVPE